MSKKNTDARFILEIISPICFYSFSLLGGKNDLWTNIYMYVDITLPQDYSRKADLHSIGQDPSCCLREDQIRLVLIALRPREGNRA